MCERKYNRTKNQSNLSILLHFVHLNCIIFAPQFSLWKGGSHYNLLLKLIQGMISCLTEGLPQQCIVLIKGIWLILGYERIVLVS
jgi:hypothetical protein